MKGTRGVMAACTAIGAAAALVTVGATGASGQLANQTFYANEGLCFTTDPAATCPASGDPAEVTIQAGEAVDVNFPGGVGTAPHNAVASSGNWTWTSDPPSSDTRTKTTPAFSTNGDYDFVCAVHGGMRATIHVQGGSTGTPTPTPSPTATPTPTPTTTPTDTTPAPHASADTVKPSVRRLRLKALRRHAARLTFTLSENATLTIRVKRGHRVLKTVRVQARKGTHSVRLRNLRKGRYTIDVRARDAAGNRSRLATKRLRVRR
jgi:plastocyanin